MAAHQSPPRCREFGHNLECIRSQPLRYGLLFFCPVSLARSNGFLVGWRAAVGTYLAYIVYWLRLPCSLFIAKAIDRHAPPRPAHVRLFAGPATPLPLAEAGEYRLRTLFVLMQSETGILEPVREEVNVITLCPLFQTDASKPAAPTINSKTSGLN